MYVFVCVCVCARERERGKKKEGGCTYMYVLCRATRIYTHTCMDDVIFTLNISLLDAHICFSSTYLSLTHTFIFSSHVQAVGEPIITRAREFDLLPESFTRLEKCVEANAQFAGSKEVKYNHISPDDRASVTEECARMGEWLQQHKDALAGASKHAMPPVMYVRVCIFSFVCAWVSLCTWCMVWDCHHLSVVHIHNHVQASAGVGA